MSIFYVVVFISFNVLITVIPLLSPIILQFRDYNSRDKAFISASITELDPFELKITEELIRTTAREAKSDFIRTECNRLLSFDIKTGEDLLLVKALYNNGQFTSDIVKNSLINEYIKTMSNILIVNDANYRKDIISMYTATAFVPLMIQSFLWFVHFVSGFTYFEIAPIIASLPGIFSMLIMHVVRAFKTDKINEMYLQVSSLVNTNGIMKRIIALLVSVKVFNHLTK